MTVRRRRGITAQERADLWARWKAGQTLSQICTALGKASGSVCGWLQANGGISPPVRQRRARELTLAHREEISRGLCAGDSLRGIAVRLGRAPSTVAREVARNGGVHRYRAGAAEIRAWGQARRPKQCKLALNSRLRRLVAGKLHADWSPEQIAGWLRREWAGDERMTISHETIYRSLFIQARGVLRKELQAHLRSRRHMRHAKTAPTRQLRGHIVDPVSIRERPAEVEDRAIPGHWEGDLLAGAGHSYIATLVERHSRFTLLVKLRNKQTSTVVAALSKHIAKLPGALRQSLTWDRGLEMAHHRAFSVATNVAVYFCDPSSPWQRGTNENTNRLLRQYFPTGTELRQYSQADLNRVARRLNMRPRKTLDFRTPADTLEQALH